MSSNWKFTPEAVQLLERDYGIPAAEARALIVARAKARALPAVAVSVVRELDSPLRREWEQACVAALERGQPLPPGPGGVSNPRYDFSPADTGDVVMDYLFWEQPHANDHHELEPQLVDGEEMLTSANWSTGDFECVYEWPTGTGIFHVNRAFGVRFEEAGLRSAGIAFGDAMPPAVDPRTGPTNGRALPDRDRWSDSEIICRAKELMREHDKPRVLEILWSEMPDRRGKTAMGTLITEAGIFPRGRRRRN